MYVQRLREGYEYTPDGEPVLNTFSEVQQRWHAYRRRYDLFLRDSPKRILSLAGDRQPQPEPVSFSQFARVDSGFLAWTFRLYDARGEVIAKITRNFRGLGREVSSIVMIVKESHLRLRLLRFLQIPVSTYDFIKFIEHTVTDVVLRPICTSLLPSPRFGGVAHTLDCERANFRGEGCKCHFIMENASTAHFYLLPSRFLLYLVCDTHVSVLTY